MRSLWPRRTGELIVSRYRLRGGDGSMDSTATFAVATGAVVFAPTVEYRPVDARGMPVRDVRLRTAFGSDHRRLLVGNAHFIPPELDLVAIDGPGAARVADIQVVVDPGPGLPIVDWTRGGQFERTILTALASADPGAPPVKAIAPRPVALSNTGWSIRGIGAIGLTNPAPFDVRLSLTWLEFGTSVPQFFSRREPIGSVLVPANGTSSIGLPQAVIDGIVSAEAAHHYCRIHTTLDPEQPGLTWPTPA